jgi:hypothetical protein
MPVFVVPLWALVSFYGTNPYVRHVIVIDFRKLKITRLALISNGIQVTSNFVNIVQLAQKLQREVYRDTPLFVKLKPDPKNDAVSL